MLDTEAMIDLNVTGMETFRKIISLLAGQGITFVIARADRPTTTPPKHYGAPDSIGGDGLCTFKRQVMESYREQNPDNATKS